MPAETGIFLDVLPRFDLAAMGAILSKVEGMFSKSGAAIGASFGAEAQAKIAQLAEAERSSANITEDAELRKTRAIHATEIAETNAALATDKRALATSRNEKIQASATATDDAKTASALRLEAATIAETKASYAAGDAALAQTARMRDLDAATLLSSQAADAHAAAVEASALKVSNASRAFNVMGAVATGAFVVAGAESVKLASNMETSQTRIQVATGETSQNIKALHDGILQLGPAVGQTAQDLSDASFILAKGGFKEASDQLAILKSGSELARVEVAPLDETMKGLTTTITDFGLKGTDAPKVVSQLQVALGAAKVPMDEFMGSLHNIEPMFKMLTGGDPAKAAGGIAQVTTALAMMTRNGTGADQASQNVRNSLSQMVSMGDNPKQSQTLGQLGLNAAALSHQLSDPAVGYLGVLNQIHEAINNKIGPDGKILENALYANPQAAQDMLTQYDKLDQSHKLLADQIQNGTIPSLKSLHLTQAEGQQGDWLKEWDKARQTVEGFNPILAKHGDLVRDQLQMWKDATGSSAGLMVGSQLYGTDEAANATNAQYQQTLAAKPDADGNIAGWDKVLDLLSTKIAQAKSSLLSMATSMGEVLLPYAKSAADALGSLFGWLNKNQGAADAFAIAIGGIAAAWTVVKAAAVVGGIWNAMATGIDFVIGKYALLRGAALETNAAIVAVGPEATAAATTVVEAETLETAAVKEVGVAAGITGKALLSAATLVGTLAAASVWASNLFNDEADKHPAAFGIDADPSKRRPSRSSQGGGDPAYNRVLAQRPGGPVNYGPSAPDGAATTDDLPFNGGPKVSPSPSAAGTMPDYSGQLPGGDGLGTDAPAGAGGTPTPADAIGSGQNNPIYVDPGAITDGLNSSDLGADGVVGNSLMSIFTDSTSGGFTLPNVAKLLGTFTANLALGNPMGKLATGGGVGDGADMQQSLADVENMSPTQRLEQQNTNKLQKAIRTYNKSLRAYAQAITKYGSGSEQAIDAQDTVLNSRDAIDQVVADGSSAGDSAAQALADDNANGTATKNPGKYAKDLAKAQAYGPGGGTSSLGGPGANPGSGPTVNPGKGAEGWRGTVADTVAKYGAAAGIPASQNANWTDAIVRQIDTESKGNPGADNPNDPNGRGGTQHVAGLLQYLPSTFANSAQNLTGITDMMNPTAQIAGALLAAHNAAGGPLGIGNGVGWGPSRQPVDTSLVQQDAPVQAPVAPGAPAKPAGTGSILGDLLQHFTGGGGQGPTFRRSPAVVNGGGAAPGTFDNSPAAVKAREAADPHFQDLLHGQANGAIGGPPPHTPAPGIPGMLGGADLPATAPGVGIMGLPGGLGSGAPKAAAPAPSAGPPGGGNKVNGAAPTPAPGAASKQPPGGSGSGGGLTGGGLIGGAISAASTAANMFAPGAGAGIQIAEEEGARAAKYAGQVAAIAVQGVQETFHVSGPDGEGGGGASGKGGWLSKIAGGLAGAHPSTPNAAAAQKDPTKPADPVKPDASKNGQPAGGTVDNSNNINIQNQNVNHGDANAQNADLQRQLMSIP